MDNGREIGAMDTRVSVQSCVIGTNSQGAKKYIFSHHSDVFAKITESDDESVVNRNLEDGRTLYVTVYKIAALTTRWRVVIDGRPYQIDSISDVSRTSPLCTLRVSSINETL